MASAVYQRVTGRILELLEDGVVPWRKPWHGGAGGLPRNLSSGRGYRGINVFLLSCMPYESAYWVTFRQAQARGGHVRKGEKSTPVVFWKPWQRIRTDPESGERSTVAVPVLRYYNLFNVEQCEGIEYPKPDAPEHRWNPLERCDALVRSMPRPPAIAHGGGAAWYGPSTDTVQMPPRERFEHAAAYYGVLFHELTHSTGHRSRLDRKGVTNVRPFGSPDYSREELVAEMGSAFLCGHCGIAPTTIENSAAYIGGWLQKLRGDARLVVQAAAAAQKSADYILGTVPEAVTA